MFAQETYADLVHITGNHKKPTKITEVNEIIVYNKYKNKFRTLVPGVPHQVFSAS